MLFQPNFRSFQFLHRILLHDVHKLTQLVAGELEVTEEPGHIGMCLREAFGGNGCNMFGIPVNSFAIFQKLQIIP